MSCGQIPGENGSSLPLVRHWPWLRLARLRAMAAAADHIPSKLERGTPNLFGVPLVKIPNKFASSQSTTITVAETPPAASVIPAQ